MRHLLVLLMGMTIVQPVAAFDLLRPDLWLAPSECTMIVPDIAIQSNRSEFLIDHSLPQESIGEIMRDLRGAVLSGWRTGGLAAAQLRSEGDTVMSIQQLSDGSWCGSLQSAQFRIGYDDPMRIYISSHYAAGSCPYQAILEHELQHVDIYRSVLDAHLHDADRRVMEAILSKGVVRGDSRQAVSAGIDAIVSAVIDDVVDEVASENRKRNGVLDTVENYLQVQSACSDW